MRISPATIAKTVWRWLRQGYVLLLALLALYIAFHWHNGDNINRIWSDSEGYYMYLPALFINGGFEGLMVLTPGQFGMYPGTNKVFTRYTCGVAIMELPFFLLAHLITTLGLFHTKHPTGYSSAYSDAIIVAAVAYVMLALELLRRMLLRHYSPRVVFATVLALWLGTNLYYYTVAEVGMSHAFSFALFVFVLYLTPRLYAAPTPGRALLMGLLLGLVVLIRPTNVLLGLYVLGYDLYTRADLRARWDFIWRHLHPLWLMVPAALAVAVPQLLYWHHLSGDWVIYSYGEAGFDFLTRPRLLRLLLDIRNGWLLFTPMMWIALTGLVALCWQNRHNAQITAWVLALVTYLFASWAFWWFGGAFGHRCYVEYYALLALPLAYSFAQIDRARPSWRVLGGAGVALLIFVSMRMAHIYASPWEGADWTWARLDAIYWEVFTF
ncbi:MAG: hypothetical protein OHK0039_43700 [Bacteroidia bacterium]